MHPRKDILLLPGYTPGRSINTVKEATGLSKIVKLASNESLWGPSPKVVQAVQDLGQTLLYYPEVKPSNLLNHIGASHGLDPALLFLGNGADEILRLVASCFVDPDTEVIYPRPSFAAYAHATQIFGGHGVAVPLTDDGAVDLSQVLRAITPKTRLIYLCNPNNPTGGAFHQDQWERFVAQVPDNLPVVVDEAYREYVQIPDYPNVESLIAQGRPFIMVRTFSKIYGLAALRLGWAMAPAPIIDWLYRVREPFSVNLAAERAGIAALEDSEWITRARHETWQMRTMLIDELERLSFPTWPSQANFVTFKVPGSSAYWTQALESRGYIVRATDSFGLPGHLRVSLAPEPIMRGFLNALRDISPPQPS